MSESTGEANASVLQFTQFHSFVDSSFWHKLSEIKVEEDKLSDAPKPISGYYTNRTAKNCILEVNLSSFNKSSTEWSRNIYNAFGTLYNKNTIEEFKSCDKKFLLQEEGERLIADFDNGVVEENPSALARFFVLSYADIKNYNYYYWFGFPCPITTSITYKGDFIKLKSLLEYEQINNTLKNRSREQLNFFVLRISESVEFYTIKEFFSMKDPVDIMQQCYFFFADCSEFGQPSWLLRIYILFIFHKCPFLTNRFVKFVGLRYNNVDIADSLMWEVTISEELNLKKGRLDMVGWEPNRNGKLLPRMVSMRNDMDPAKLAESSINLNLKLMKWRLLPELNLNKIYSSKCLLMGAGTLGCAVARNLLAWGFKHITFVDNGRVNYSNPVRQSLYTYKDAIKGNTMKAEIAAERLREIDPSVVSKGYVIQIPMPGHTVGDALKDETSLILDQLITLVKETDVVFMLTDSRESRWLPTLLGAAYEKITINAALGFDSYLVMRHGSNRKGINSYNATDVGDLKCIPGSQLGCYFCNDVTAPGNSMKDRTLDQQCTVTRPAVSNIAASYAVELLVALLQHAEIDGAPAYFSHTGKHQTLIPEGLLGVVPHSIRGQLSNFENVLPATQRFSQCIACSETVVQEYMQYGKKFLFKVIESTKCLENLTGISEFEALDNAIIDFDSDE